MTTTDNKPKVSKDGTVILNLTVPLTEIAVAYQKALGKIASTAEIKGFRKGKAPVNMVEESLDKNRVYNQMIEEILPPLYTKAIREAELKPLIYPHISPVQFEEGKDWIFAVTLAIKPEIDLGDYKKYVKKATSLVEKGHESHDHSKDILMTAIFDALLAGCKLEIAPLLVEEEAKTALGKLASQLNSLKLTIADYAKSLKKTADELVEEYKKTANTNLKLEFILQAIAIDQKFTGDTVRRQTLDFLSAL